MKQRQLENLRAFEARQCNGERRGGNTIPQICISEWLINFSWMICSRPVRYHFLFFLHFYWRSPETCSSKGASVWKWVQKVCAIRWALMCFNCSNLAVQKRGNKFGSLCVCSFIASSSHNIWGTFDRLSWHFILEDSNWITATLSVYFYIISWVWPTCRSSWKMILQVIY